MGAAPGGLWGVLGSADPELVCRVNASCIIKRNSGWTTAPAGAVPRIVTLQGGVLWGLEASGISGIDAHGWTLSIPAPAWSEPQAFWATRGEAWVSTEQELFHYREGKWLTVSSPVGRVASFWGIARILCGSWAAPARRTSMARAFIRSPSPDRFGSCEDALKTNSGSAVEAGLFRAIVAG